MSNLKTVLLFLPILLTGCVSPNSYQQSANHYYLNPDKDLSNIGRTALIELANDSSFPQMSSDVTESLFQALQKKQLFGLTLVRQNDLAWQSLQMELITTYSFEQLAAMRKTLKCNAVLVGTITGFKPYPHTFIGLRLKLIDLTDGQLLWALEQVWDTTDKTTEERIKNYYSRRNIVGFTIMEDELGTVSSLKFVKFVAHEVAETLQAAR